MLFHFDNYYINPSFVSLCDPAQVSAVSCVQAFNTMAYSATLSALLRDMYNDGSVVGLKSAVREFNLCLDLTGLRNKKPEAAQQMLAAATAAADAETPHVFTFRAQPKFFKLLDFSRIDVTGEEQARAEAAAKAAAAAVTPAAAAVTGAGTGGRSWWWPWG